MVKAKYKVQSFLLIFIFINSFIIASLPSYNIFINSFQSSHEIILSGSTPPTFFNFSPNKSIITNPTCTLSVNDTESGLNVGSEEFGYTRDGSFPSDFMNPHNDIFNDGIIAQFWKELNPENGTISEELGILNINDTGNHNWHNGPGDANALVQTIAGDFNVIVKVGTTLSVNPDQAGILVRQDDNNFIKVVYIYGLNNIRNVAFWKTIDGTPYYIAHSGVGPQSEIYLNLERDGNDWIASYSLDGDNFISVDTTSENFSNQMNIGLFVGNGIEADFDDWTITPFIHCTGENGTTNTQQITINEVPFNQYHPSNNKIQIRMRDMNTNLATSALYTVNISTNFGGLIYTNFNPNVTSDITPDVTIQVQDVEDGLLIGSEQFAYSTDGSIPSNFINPHRDDFSDGILANFWATVRKLGNIIIETNNLTIQNTQFSTEWNDDPLLYQNIDGDFTAIAKISATVAGEGNQSGIAFEDGDDMIRIIYTNTSNNEISVNLSYSIDGGDSNTIIGSITIGKTNPIWLKFVRSGNIFYGYYSLNGEYGIYSEVANISLSFDNIGSVGIFTGGGELATFEDWEISPYISVTGVNGTTNPETLTVHEVPFNQIHETNNKIRFMMSDMIENPGMSNIYTVNTTEGYYIYQPDLTLANKEGRIELFDFEGNTIWFYEDSGCDIEMLPDGNIMYVKVLWNGGFVRIVNYTDKSTIWHYEPTGSEILDWTHDADILPWGDILIADTTNDATHRDEVFIVNYTTQEIEWIYTCDEGSYPNDADYLPNGNILISLRNYDMVIEVNYTACKDDFNVTYPDHIVWSYGETGNYSLMNHQHNPDRLPNGNTIICDSENDRIIEVDPNGNVVWMYDGNGSTTLDWARDADRLPNGNTLIGDSNNRRVLEINTTTAEIIWELDLGSGGSAGSAYDVNRIDTTPPAAIINSPLNTTYNTESIDVTLTSNDRDVDTFWYRIYNDTSNEWVDNGIIIWNQTEQRTLGDGNYTIYAWCNDTGYREGSWNWMPSYKGNIQSGNVTTSFTINTQLATFWNFRPNQTTDTTPTVYINVQESRNGLKNGSEEFAFTTDGSNPAIFGNPHRDMFVDGEFAPFWSFLNAANGTVKEENGFLNLTDNGKHEWYDGSHDAIMVYQNLVQDFTVHTKISVNQIEPTNYFGIIVYQDDSNYLTVAYYNNSEGELNVMFSKTENKNTTSFMIENFSTFGFLNPIWLKLTRTGDYWTATFSPNGDTYAIYYDICTPQNITFSSKVKVGLFVANESSALFDDWIISPYMEVNETGSPTEVKTIQVYDIMFKQYDEINNKIKFQVKNQFNITSSSPIYTVNISNFAISFRDNTIYGDIDKKIYVINRFGNIVHTIDVSGLGVEAIADVEWLSNGNILFVDMHQTGSDSAVYEINSTGYVVWSYKPSGVNRLEWTHDADRLDNGNTLIADTSNSEMHEDRIIEVNSTGDIVWAYYTGEGSYPNDVDRLSNGNTLISLRNLDKIIEVDTNGTIVWEYDPGNPDVLNHQHNPDRLPNGNIIICDSENNRIIEINSTTKEIVWMYNGNGTTILNWPRDADLLMDGNLLITDSKNHRIIEINMTTGDIIWEIETIGVIYEADRLNSFIIPAKIFSPLENETMISQTIDLVLSSPNPFTDCLWYRLYDNTTSQWIDLLDQTAQKYQIFSNGHWNIRQKRILKDNHSYTLYAWVNASFNSVDGGDQHITTQITPTKTYFTINCSYIPNSNEPYPGFTLVHEDIVFSHSRIQEINLEGDIIWEFDPYPVDYAIYDAERLPNGNTLISAHSGYLDNGSVIEIDYFGNVVWSYSEARWCHDADRLPNGNTILLHENSTFWGILEVNPEKEIIWSWNKFDHEEYYSFPYMHLNDIDLLSNGNFLVSARDWDMVLEIDRNGDTVWYFGEIGNYSLINHQHNPDRLPNGNTIICDSENNRIIEINSTTKQIVWMYDGNSSTTLDWARDADRLPNGNTLIADSWNHRYLEINYQGEIIWESNWYWLPYSADRLDSCAPYVLINTPLNQTYTSNRIPLNLYCPEKDVDSIWFNVYDHTNHSWVFSINQTYLPNSNLYLTNGSYTLFAWSNDTGRLPGTMDDIHPNIQEIPSVIDFTVAYEYILLSPQNITYDDPYFDIAVKNTTNFKQISATLEIGTNISTFNLIWNGSIFKTSIMLSIDGCYKLNIAGNDSFNVVHENIIWFTLEKTSPMFKDIFIEYDSLELGLSQKVSLTFYELSLIKNVTISINNAPNETMYFNSTHYSYEWTPMMINLGYNSFEIFAENYYNKKNSTIQSFMVNDTTTPQIYNITIKTKIQLGQLQILSFNVSDLGGIKKVILQLDNGTNITLPGNYYYSYSWIPTKSGNVSVTIYVTDISNNTKILTLFFISQKNSWFWLILIIIIIGIVSSFIIYKMRKNKRSKRRIEQKKTAPPSIKQSIAEEPVLPKKSSISEKSATSKKSTTSEKSVSSGKKVSIVILTWNKLEYIKKCLKFLEKNTNYPDWEVIVVDNGSEDGTQKFLKELENSNSKKYKIILNNLNLGYPKGINQGFKIAEGKYILLLNNDVYVLKNWLNSMIDVIESDEKNAIVGAKLIYPKTNHIQHAGIVFIRKIEPLHIYKNCSMNDLKVNEIRYVDAVTGACMLIKQELIEKIGLFDERFKFIGFEDTDFCLRCRIRGYGIVYSPNSVVIHEERVTASQMNKYYTIFNYNRKLFFRKWANILEKYNDRSLKTSFKLRMYLIFGIFKIIPKKLEFFIKKWLTAFLNVQ